MEWVDRTNIWESLAVLKDSCKMQLVDYSKVNDLINEPEFSWWCPGYLWKRRRMISNIKSCYWKTHKYGTQVPKLVEEAVRIDKDNGNTLWQDSKDNNRITFDVREEGE